MNEWNYLAATYDYLSGVTSLYHNNVLVADSNTGSYVLATDYSLRLGVLDGATEQFHGGMACLQIYSRALNASEIAEFESCPRRKWKVSNMDFCDCWGGYWSSIR